MRELNRQGSTIVLVTHNMFLMQTIASRALWLKGGQVAGYGNPMNVIGQYRQTSEKTGNASPALVHENPISIGNLEMSPESHWASASEAFPDSGVRLMFTVDCGPGNFIFSLRVTSPDDGLQFFTVYSDPTELSQSGRVSVEAVIPSLMLMPGEYRVWIAICSELGEEQMLANDSLPLKIASGTANANAQASSNLMWNKATWRVSKPK
jgi:ABC-type glutathione transport system ATPase component